MCVSIYIYICICSSENDGVKLVEPLIPSEGSKPGDRVIVEGYEQGEPDKILNPKKKIWEQLQVIYLINLLWFN